MRPGLRRLLRPRPGSSARTTTITRTVTREIHPTEPEVPDVVVEAVVEKQEEARRMDPAWIFAGGFLSGVLASALGSWLVLVIDRRWRERDR